jgi:hypothetical protein
LTVTCAYLPITIAELIGQTVPVTGVLRASGRDARRAVVIAALVSVVTMPLTAVWFLLAGGVLLLAGLVPAALGRTSTVGPAAFVGLGLLAGPAIYVGLAALQ